MHPNYLGAKKNFKEKTLDENLSVLTFHFFALAFLINSETQIGLDPFKEHPQALRRPSVASFKYP